MSFVIISRFMTFPHGKKLMIGIHDSQLWQTDQAWTDTYLQWVQCCERNLKEMWYIIMDVLLHTQQLRHQRTSTPAAIGIGSALLSSMLQRESWQQQFMQARRLSNCWTECVHAPDKCLQHLAQQLPIHHGLFAMPETLSHKHWYMAFVKVEQTLSNTATHTMTLLSWPLRISSLWIFSFHWIR